jgi:hypothetical protein
MGCNNYDSDKIQGLIEESLKGESSGIESCSTEIRETIEKDRSKIKEDLKRADERWKRIESLNNEYSEIEIRDVLELDTACGHAKELIKNADSNSIIISRQEKIPIFATDLEDIGQELSKSMKEYPKKFPEVKIYSPILPTKENLSIMLIKRKNPKSPWGKTVNLHHYLQNPEGPLMMVEDSLHQKSSGVIHKKNKSLSKEERYRYDTIQRPNIWKSVAEAYLGKRLLKDFKDAIKLEKKKNG